MKIRDKSMTILLIVVFSLTFFVLWNVADLAARIRAQDEGEELYLSGHTLSAYCSVPAQLRADGEQDEAMEYFENFYQGLSEFIGEIGECNISFPSLYFPVRYRPSYAWTEIVAAQNESLPYELQETYDADAPLYVGESLKKYIKNDGERHIINLNKHEFEVAGILKNYGMSGQDERVIILYGALPDGDRAFVDETLVKYFFDNYGTGIKISVDGDDAASVAQAFGSLVSFMSGQEGVTVQTVPAGTQSGEQNNWYRQFNSWFDGIAAVFSVLCILTVSGLWFARRRRELLIRRVFGCRAQDIWIVFIKDIFLAAIISLAISTVLYIVYAAASGRGIEWARLPLQCLVMLAGAVIIVMIATAFPTAKTMSAEPAESLGRYRG
ncbi:MAG: hypothetical protein LUI02_00095 [Clostridiales bacterium]|nr:hypothetical protein [Clostridiales bacterium]